MNVISFQIMKEKRKKEKSIDDARKSRANAVVVDQINAGSFVVHIVGLTARQSDSRLVNSVQSLDSQEQPHSLSFTDNKT